MLALPALAGSAAYALGELLSWHVGLAPLPLRAEAFHATIAPSVVLGVPLNLADRSDPGAVRERSAEWRGCASGDGHDDAPCASRSWRDSRCHYPCRSWAGWPPQTMVATTFAMAASWLG
jgi:hypothetical protein